MKNATRIFAWGLVATFAAIFILATFDTLIVACDTRAPLVEDGPHDFSSATTALHAPPKGADLAPFTRGPRGFSKTITVNSTTTTAVVYNSTFPQAQGLCTVNTTGLNVFLVEEGATTTTNGDGPYCDSDTCPLRGPRFIVGGFDFARTSSGSGTITCRFYDTQIYLGSSIGSGGGGGSGTFMKLDGSNAPTTGEWTFLDGTNAAPALNFSSNQTGGIRRANAAENVMGDGFPAVVVDGGADDYVVMQSGFTGMTGALETRGDILAKATFVGTGGRSLLGTNGTLRLTQATGATNAMLFLEDVAGTEEFSMLVGPTSETLRFGRNMSVNAIGAATGLTFDSTSKIMHIDYVNKRVGFGTDTPLRQTHITNAAGQTSNVIWGETIANAAADATYVQLLRSHTGSGAARAVLSGDLLAEVDYGGHNGIDYVATVKAQGVAAETFGGSYGSDYVVSVVPVGGTQINFREAMRLKGAGAVFNEDGNDMNFRIESDTNTTAFDFDGTDGNIGIGVAASTSATTPLKMRRDQNTLTRLQVQNEATTSLAEAALEVTNNVGGFVLITTSTTFSNGDPGLPANTSITRSSGLVTGGMIVAADSPSGSPFSNDVQIALHAGGTAKQDRIHVRAANTIVNDDGNNVDFIVESDTLPTALAVAGATGNTSLAANLAVNGGDITSTSATMNIGGANTINIGNDAAVGDVNLGDVVNAFHCVVGSGTGNMTCDGDYKAGGSGGFGTFSADLDATFASTTADANLTGADEVHIASQNGLMTINSNATMSIAAENAISIVSQAEVNITANNSSDVNISSDNDIDNVAPGKFTVNVNDTATINASSLTTTTGANVCTQNGTDFSCTTGYVGIKFGTATAPSGDCDAAGESGRAYFETDAEILSICNGSAWSGIVLPLAFSQQAAAVWRSDFVNFLRDAMLIALAMTAIVARRKRA